MIRLKVEMGCLIGQKPVFSQHSRMEGFWSIMYASILHPSPLIQALYAVVPYENKICGRGVERLDYRLLLAFESTFDFFDIYTSTRIHAIHHHHHQYNDAGRIRGRT